MNEYETLVSAMARYLYAEARKSYPPRFDGSVATPPWSGLTDWERSSWRNLAEGKIRKAMT